MKIKRNEKGFILVKPDGMKKYYDLYHRVKNGKYYLYIKKSKNEDYVLNFDEMKQFVEFVEGIDL